MGREIRKVPPNWDHPRDARGEYKSMYDETFAAAVSEWKARRAAWEVGERPEGYGDCDFADYYGEQPDDPDMYRPWQDAEAIWLQVWETVSEGSPVTPPFETKQGLADYLAEHGDFWDHGRGWGQARADAFVADGWAPSMMISGGRIYESKDIPLAFAKDEA